MSPRLTIRRTSSGDRRERVPVRAERAPAVTTRVRLCLRLQRPKRADYVTVRRAPDGGDRRRRGRNVGYPLRCVPRHPRVQQPHRGIPPPGSTNLGGANREALIVRAPAERDMIVIRPNRRHLALPTHQLSHFSDCIAASTKPTEAGLLYLLIARQAEHHDTSAVERDEHLSRRDVSDTPSKRRMGCSWAPIDDGHTSARMSPPRTYAWLLIRFGNAGST